LTCGERGKVFCVNRLRGGLGAAKPFDDGDTVPDPRAVGDLDATRRGARRARQEPRQGFRIGETDVAAGAGDLEHH
jgi:hypothetical protein